MAQIRFRIDTVQTAGADQPVQQCTTLAAVIATEEHVIFLSETDCTKRSFRCVIGVRLENGKYPTLRLFFVRFDIDTA